MGPLPAPPARPRRDGYPPPGLVQLGASRNNNGDGASGSEVVAVLVFASGHHRPCLLLLLRLARASARAFRAFRSCGAVGGGGGRG